jgi:hypothetical protein
MYPHGQPCDQDPQGELRSPARVYVKMCLVLWVCLEEKRSERGSGCARECEDLETKARVLLLISTIQGHAIRAPVQ